MQNLPDDSQLAAALRDGLHALPVPEASPNFDARVFAALRGPIPWWQRLWQPAQPLLAGASFSLLVTLACLHWSLSAPLSPTPPLLGAGGPSSLAVRPLPSVDALLDRPNLSEASLSAYWNDPPAVPPSPNRRPEPRRRAQSFRRPALLA